MEPILICYLIWFALAFLSGAGAVYLTWEKLETPKEVAKAFIIMAMCGPMFLFPIIVLAEIIGRSKTMNRKIKHPKTQDNDSGQP